MSRYSALGINPKTKHPVDIFYGYDDTIPGAQPGFYFQVALHFEDPDFNDEVEYHINEGYFDGLSKDTFLALCKEWQPNQIHPTIATITGQK